MNGIEAHFYKAGCGRGYARSAPKPNKGANTTLVAVIVALAVNLLPVAALAGHALIPGQNPDSPIPPRHIYGVTTDGTLLVYVDNSSDAAMDWIATAVPAPALPGVDWSSFVSVFAGGDGAICAIDIFNQLRYFRLLDQWRNRVPMSWSADSNLVIGEGFAYFDSVVGLSRLPRTEAGYTVPNGGTVIRDGALWATESDGTTLLYQHGWKAGGFVDGDEWSHGGLGVEAPLLSPAVPAECATCFLFEGGEGLTYAVAADGTLRRYRIRPRGDWVNGGVGLPIGVGWSGFRFLFASPGAYFIEGYVSTAQLAPNGAMTVAPMSVPAGGVVRVRASTFSPEYAIRLLRLQRHTADDAVAPSGLIDGITVGSTKKAKAPAGGNFKKAFDFAMYANGAGWSGDRKRDIKISRRAKSGIYAAELTTPSGGRYLAPFVVKPNAKSRLGRIAVIANVTTWQAYNMWGGGSRYKNLAFPELEDQGAPSNYEVSYERPQLETDPLGGTIGAVGLVNRDPAAFNHLTRSEIWVTTWLDGLAAVDEEYAYDVYSDVDLDVGIASLSQYKVVLIDTHPEYWSDNMRDNLDAYLVSGGHLIYLAGNGLYDRVTLADSAVMRIARGVGGEDCTNSPNAANPCPARDLFRFSNASYPDGRSERAVLGVSYPTFGGYLGLTSSYGFTISRNNPFFVSAGLGIGDVLGSTAGLNHGMAASAWEADTYDPTIANYPCGEFPYGVCTASYTTLVGTEIARADNGASIVFHQTGFGTGWVFSAGAIPVAGVLAIDPTLQAVVQSALDRALDF